MLPINELLQEGRYRVTRHFGQNDIGSIYEGLDNIFEKNITINQCAYNGRKNLADEEKILKGIKHETFLSVADYFAEPNGWFIVMETADGEIFSDVLKNENRDFSFSEVMNWAEQILDGLGYLHLHLPPIVYGDLKPQNMFLAPDGKIKMLTSAILKTRSANKTIGKPSAEALNYSPLEQIWDNLDLASQKVIAASFDETAEKILRQPVDARCDIYSLGVLLYQTLIGQFPKNALERSIEILEGNPDPLISPSSLNTEIPPEVSEIILKALEIRRENRFDSAVIMRQALRTAFVRIKEREEAGEVQQTEQPPTAAAATESFSFSDLSETKKAEPIREAEIEENEQENLLTEIEDIQEAEKPSAVQDFEILSLDLPLTQLQGEPLKEDHAKVTPAEKEQPDEAEEMREELIAENKSESDTKKISTEFFHFDEEDEEEILGVRKSSEEIKKSAETPEMIEEKAQVIEEKTEVVSAADSEKVIPEVIETDYKKDYSPDEFSILFDEAEKKSGSKWKVPLVALILVLVGSGAFGAWMFASKSGSNADGQTVTNQLDAKPPVNTASQTPAENLTETNTETQTIETTENNANAETATEANIVTNPVLTQETAPTAKKNPAVKAKPNTEKPQTATAKSPEKKAKKVTVDDLISDY